MLRSRSAIGLAGLMVLCVTQNLQALDSCSYTEDINTDGIDYVTLQTVVVDTNSFMLGYGGRNTSGCYEYPSQEESLYCADILGDHVVYMPNPQGGQVDLADILAVEVKLAAVEVELSTTLATINAECLGIFRAYACVSKYPVCQEGNNNGVFAPIKMSTEACELINSKCSELFEKHSNLITSCSATSTTEEPQYFFRPNEWIGSDIWDQSSSTDSLSETDLEELATGAGYDNVTCVYPLVATQGRTSSNSITCEYPERFPVYTDVEWTAMWLIFVVPALLSLPFNAFAFYKSSQEVRRQRRRPVLSFHRPKYRTDRKKVVIKLFRLSALCGILFVSMSALPAAILNFQVGLISQSGDTIKESAACWVTKLSPFFLQALVNSCTLTLVIIWLRVRAATRMQNYRGSRRERLYEFLFVVLVPAIFGTVALVLEEFTLYNNDGMLVEFQNRFFVRNAFLCFPRLRYTWCELILVHLPLICASTIGLAMAISISLMLRSEQNSCIKVFTGNMDFATTTTISYSANSMSSSSSHASDSVPSRANGSGSSQNWKTINRRVKDEGLALRITAQGIRFGSSNFLFVVLSFVMIMLIELPLGNFAVAMFQWWDCSNNEGYYECVESLQDTAFNATSCCAKCILDGFSTVYPDVCYTCSDAPSSSELFGNEGGAQAYGLPSHAIFLVFYFSWAMIPLAFGVSFTIAHLKHVSRRYDEPRPSVSTARSHSTGVTSFTGKHISEFAGKHMSGFASSFRRTPSRGHVFIDEVDQDDDPQANLTRVNTTRNRDPTVSGPFAPIHISAPLAPLPPSASLRLQPHVSQPIGLQEVHSSQPFSGQQQYTAQPAFSQTFPFRPQSPQNQQHFQSTPSRPQAPQQPPGHPSL